MDIAIASAVSQLRDSSYSEIAVRVEMGTHNVNRDKRNIRTAIVLIGVVVVFFVGVFIRHLQ